MRRFLILFPLLCACIGFTVQLPAKTASPLTTAKQQPETQIPAATTPSKSTPISAPLSLATPASPASKTPVASHRATTIPIRSTPPSQQPAANAAVPASQLAAGGGFVFPVLNVAGYYAANFGELRAGHFHAGVDIKTDGVEGRPLVAVADGYISRVSVTPGGYGRALYLTLTDGRLAVYGHIAHFRDDIEQLVDAERHRKRSNTARLWFTPGQFSVRKGDRIASAGNSGSSMGPHLHFELRDTAGTMLNTVRMGIFQPDDNIPPIIMRLHYIEIDTIRGVCIQTPLKTYNAALIGGGRYRLLHDGPIDAGRKGFFVLEASDRRNGVRNTFGLYRVSLSVDDDKRFEYRMDDIPSGFSRYSSAATYYPLKINSRNEVLRLAQLAAMPDYFYPVAKERGIIRTAVHEIRHLRIEAEDDCGNLSTLEFEIRGHAETFHATADSTAVVLRHDHMATIRCGTNVTVRIPSGALYEPIFCYPKVGDTCQAPAGVKVLSPTYRILNATTPLHRDVDIAIRIHIPAHQERHATLAWRSPSGNMMHIGGKYADGQLTARTTKTGDLIVVADTAAPVIRPLFKESADLTQATTLRFRVSDNFSSIDRYSLRIDGQWVPCDQFPIKGTLSHTLEPAAGKRKHDAELIVSDGCGNTTHWHGTFYR